MQNKNCDTDLLKNLEFSPKSPAALNEKRTSKKY
ncbi:MAG: hypothetical protein ACI9V8_000867, partial [Urechidicola sp.]